MIAALLLAAATPALSPAEATMVRTVDAEQPRSIALLQRLVDRTAARSTCRASRRSAG